MTTDYVTLPPHITVREALERLRQEAPDRETIYYCYVVDHQRRLIGFVSLFGLDFGALVGGAALLTEVVFGLHGIGKLTYDSLQNLDLPVILATVIYAAFFVVIANAIVDLLYAWLDPRVRIA